MPVQVAQKEKKPQKFGGILELGGQVLSYFPQTAAIGQGVAAAGKGLGTVENAGLVNNDSAMGRRLETSQGFDQAPQAQDPMQALQAARVELQSQPPEVRQQYEPSIRLAMIRSQRQQGGNV